MKPAIWTGMYVEAPLHEAIRTLRNHGWRSFEISTEHLVAIENADDPVRPTAAAQEELADGAAPQAHGYLQANVADPDPDKRAGDVNRLKRHIEICAALGVRVVVIHPGGRRSDETREERDLTERLNVDSFNRLADRAESLGVRIALENLMRRGAATAYEMLDLVDRIGRASLGLTLDTSHARVMGLDIAKMIGEIGPLLIATHVSDNDGSGDQHLTPGNGSIEWAAVVAALRRVKYDGLLNFEIPGERHADGDLRALKSRHAAGVAEWMVRIER